ncbi:MAG: glycoside hydrolase family 28 protein [Candidatus Izemoplasmatales bacterium]|jgi:polygalacturonase|nr:glycoside hydrolase family 28 protein [Candidatus Izemoplasmatales bacterium]MDY0373496.1 glycoside hydrolase family 28 protein [Candidatus Izemoplasmatales bacterium]
MFQILYVSSRSVTIELLNHEPFYSPKPYSVFLNGKIVRKNMKTNVCSLFHLLPNTEYQIQIDDEKISFNTTSESSTADVRRLGACGDGIHDDTIALQSIILSCPKHGRIFFPKGTYLSGPLFLKSNITIELDKDAILLGDPEGSHYPILPARAGVDAQENDELSSWEGVPNPTYASLITGIQVENVHIIGEGVIDANAQHGDWWIRYKEKKAGAYRAKGLFLSRCSDIHLQGITIKNTPSWNLHPYLSDYIDVIDVRLKSPKNSPNTDGCNPESCRNVRIIGVQFSVGDDCIAIKSGRVHFDRQDFPPCEAITIRNCHMAYGHGGVVLGSEMSGGIRDLDVRQCFFEHTDRGLRIKTRRGRGKQAIIDRIVFEDIRMDNVSTPLVMNMFYYCDEDGKTEYVYSKARLPVDDRTPYLGSFTFRRINCTNVHAAAGFFYGLPEQPIGRIELSQVHFSYHPQAKAALPAMMSFLDPMRKAGLIFHEVSEVLLNDVQIDHPVGEPVELVHVEKFTRRII